MATKMYLPPKGEPRRGFLKKGFFGGLLLALGGGTWVALRPGKAEPLPPGGLKLLTPREYALVAAVARRLVPPRAGWPATDALGVAAHIDELLDTRLDPTAVHELRQLLALLENGLSGLLLVGAPTPFTLLSPEQQDRVLDDWATSRLVLRRSGFDALRTLVMGVYFNFPTVWPAIGYPGPPVSFHDPNAPVWKGGGQPRPPGLGVWVEPAAEPEKAP